MGWLGGGLPGSLCFLRRPGGELQLLSPLNPFIIPLTQTDYTVHGDTSPPPLSSSSALTPPTYSAPPSLLLHLSSFFFLFYPLLCWSVLQPSPPPPSLWVEIKSPERPPRPFVDVLPDPVFLLSFFCRSILPPLPPPLFQTPSFPFPCYFSPCHFVLRQRRHLNPQQQQQRSLNLLMSQDFAALSLSHSLALF